MMKECVSSSGRLRYATCKCVFNHSVFSCPSTAVTALVIPLVASSSTSSPSTRDAVRLSVRSPVMRLSRSRRSSLEAEGEAPDLNPCARAADAATPPNRRLAAIPKLILWMLTRPMRYTAKLRMR